ncbi:hypothetical protein L596_026958 [Steinernema carpocapsae]|uniref:Paired domain-containing protein n=1 Tax=Steinernema carpocapsae TaxID=34508 RepID=A0A4U5M2W5_STECR|nr:hypothetical protein L596_026958 [Steinernema carpocapsae]
MVNEETRAAVVALHKQGMRNPAIVKMLDLHRNKVKRIGTDSKRQGRSRTGIDIEAEDQGPQGPQSSGKR